jgi:hypothetical protein
MQPQGCTLFQGLYIGWTRGTLEHTNSVSPSWIDLKTGEGSTPRRVLRKGKREKRERRGGSWHKHCCLSFPGPARPGHPALTWTLTNQKRTRVNRSASAYPDAYLGGLQKKYYLLRSRMISTRKKRKNNIKKNKLKALRKPQEIAYVSCRDSQPMRISKSHTDYPNYSSSAC